ncbi:MAG: hypothetical protein WC719_00820 [Patescibacteria group bacterium]|jgi:hypothetical protein
MTNSELIAKLNNLKSIDPDQKWLESNRELLLSQVSNSGAETLSTWRVIFINVSSVMKSAAQPVYALGAFVLLLLTGSLFSGQLLASTKPNDSLYIARILSEKVKLNTTFDSTARNRMEMKFASSHAQDITAVLADPAFNNEENKDQVAKLNNSFSEEVNTVKESISRLNAAIVPAAKTGDEVVIADSSKDAQGIQVADGSALNAAVATIAASAQPAISATATLVVPAGMNLKATSAEIAASSTEIAEPTAADKMIDEAIQLFSSKDYEKASDKLKEVSETIK